MKLLGKLILNERLQHRDYCNNLGFCFCFFCLLSVHTVVSQTSTYREVIIAPGLVAEASLCRCSSKQLLLKTSKSTYPASLLKKETRPEMFFVREKNFVKGIGYSNVFPSKKPKNFFFCDYNLSGKTLY